ncbi:MAG: glycosyl transferase [Butyrivibrio sp.]|nr:glycosyl transferase [Butyrivibrio sp.]
MIGTKFLDGQGLGNQLFAYVTARAIAAERGVPFGTAGRDFFANNIHSRRGMYFMELDLGEEISDEAAAEMHCFQDADERLYLGNSVHDLTRGVYISGAAPSIHQVPDNTLLMGNLQAEDYFAHCMDDLRQWLVLRPEADDHTYTADDLCIINLRGGEYAGDPALFLGRRYYLQAMRQMRQHRPDMRFLVITEDEAAARRVLPELEAHHFDMGRDYAVVKNARYLILSNSSFAVLPAMTSDTLRYAIAPKYWARHNVSDGYWASEQNIYSLFHYMDRAGRLFTAEECRAELTVYKQNSRRYALRNIRPRGIALGVEKCKCTSRKSLWWMGRAGWSLLRRAGLTGRQGWK